MLIHWHGRLRKIMASVADVDWQVSSIAEAIKAAAIQVRDLPRGINAHVLEAGTDLQIFGNCTLKEIHVVPAFSGGGGFGQILLGGLLIFASFVMPPAWVTMSSLAFNLGVSMALGGVLAMLAPVPERDGGNSKASYYFGAGDNTVRSGTRIPVVFGTYKLYGHILSQRAVASDQT